MPLLPFSCRAAAELGEGHHADAVLVPARREVAIEGRHRRPTLAEQVRVRRCAALAGVRVEAVDARRRRSGAPRPASMSWAASFRWLASGGLRVRHLRLRSSCRSPRASRCWRRCSTAVRATKSSRPRLARLRGSADARR